jgi:hypothetical protein
LSAFERLELPETVIRVFGTLWSLAYASRRAAVQSAPPAGGERRLTLRYSCAPTCSSAFRRR